MNFVVTHDNVNISDHVISYSRNQQICSGVGTLDVVLENENLNRNIIPWDIIRLFEEGNKIGTYIVTSVIESSDRGIETLQCQDNSKKLIDNFITDSFTIDYATTTRYWIEYFLNDTGLDYEFTTGSDGEVVAPNSQFGMSTAYDVILTFLQQSGWYIYFDKDGGAVVGNIEKAGDAYDDVINEADILSVQRMRNDNRLRNRAVVWGMGDPVTGTWIGADITRITSWNYDSNDQRAIVFSNSMIYSTAVAEDLARKMLNEFAHIANEIIVELIGHYDIKIGDMVRINSDAFTGRMMVTTIESMGGESGMIVRLTLNQKCPRLFAYFGTLGEFIPVYVGTWGQGVWMKYTGSTYWTDVSTGLVGDALRIKDLFVKMGNMVCVADDGYMYYANTLTNSWIKFEHGDLIDLNVNLYLEATVRAVACSIDDTGNAVVGYNYLSEDGLVRRSWVLTVSGTGTLLKAEQIIPQDEVSYTEEIELIDLEAVGNPEEGIIESISTQAAGGASLFGSKTQQPYPALDPSCYTLGPTGSLTWVYDVTKQKTVSGLIDGYIVDTDDTCWYLTGFGLTYPNRLLKVDLTTMNTLSESAFTGISGNGVFVFQKYITNTFNIIQVRMPTAQEILDGIYGLILKQYRYTVGDSSASVLYQTVLPQFEILDAPYFYSGNIKQVYIKGNTVIIDYDYNDVIKVYVHNTLNGSGDGYTLDINIIRAEHPDIAYSIVKRFSVQDTDAVYTGHVVVSRPTNIIKGNTDAKIITFYLFYYRIASSGGVVYTPMLKIKDYETTYDTIALNYISYGGLCYYLTGGASTDFTTTLLTEFVLSEWTIPPPLIVQPSVREAQRNVVMCITLPMNTAIDDSITYGGAEGATYTDGFLLHIWDNISVKDNGHIPPVVNAMSGRVHDPLYIRTSTGGGIPNTTSTVTKIVFTYTDLSQGDVVIEDIGYTFGSTSLKVYATRDDADGSIYIYMDNYPTVPALRNLYGFRSNGNIDKTISSYNISLLGEGSHVISKNYDFGNRWIRRFTPPILNTSKVLRHTSAPFEGGLIGASLEAAQQSYGIFEVILSPPEKTRVEISKGVPTIVYSTPLISGSLNPLLVLPDHTVIPYLAATFSNAPDSFISRPEFINGDWEFRDVRVFDTPTDGFMLASGTLPSSILERYIAMTTSGEVIIIRYDLEEEIYPLVTISGLMILTSGMIPPADPNSIINLIETTNYTLEPYFFIATSGTTPLFFQRTVISGYNSGWVNHSYGMPISGITIIRVDDDL